MRLKHLQLYGYKTFASKTRFLFPSGITAIVGPNGSGKSNVADAIRWVLGEQSYKTLRGKSTQDMIFAGSQSRPRAGMAEVVLTLDNSDGQLPVDYSEVTIGRRAHRDGQNEYRLNGNRVLLRDVMELLSQGGLGRRNYTIIGQGVVDEVLSLHADERRVLFEQAAGISHYRDKRADTLRKLQDTQRNLERVHDIVVEIEPRLKRLQKQAERAQQHDELSVLLEQLLRTWYGYRWGQSTTALDQAQETVRQRTAQHKQRRQDLQALSERIDQARQAQNELRRQLGQWHSQSSALHTQAEKSQRELAVLTERSRQLAVQREEHLAEIATLDARLAAQGERVAQAQGDAATADQALTGRQEQARAAQRALDTRLEKRRAAQRAHSAALERQNSLNADVAKRQSSQEALAERAATLAAQTQANQAEIAQLQNTLDGQLAQAAQVKSRLAQHERELEQASQAFAKLEQQRRALTEQLASQQSDLRRARETEAEVAARFEMLSQLRRDLSIYGQATRALLVDQALPGIHGVLAQLIQVPADRAPELSTALEAALGAYAGAVVVADWQTAAGALRHLRSSGTAGRVVLLPLEASPWQSEEQAEGDALSAQVHCEEALRPLVNRLLGRAYLVPDLQTARERLPHLPPGALCVTPQGQVLRADGAIEGGKAAAQTSPLTQEREWARLNSRRVELGAEREAQQATVDQGRAALEALQKQLADSSIALDELRARRAVINTELDQALRQAERLEQELEWRRSQVDSAEKNQQALQQRQQKLAEEIAKLEQAQAAASAQAKQAEADLNDLPSRALNQELTSAQVALAAARQTRQGRQSILHELQASLKQLEQERQSRSQRASKLADEKESVVERAAVHKQEQADFSARLQALTTQIEPAQARLTASEERLTILDQDERQERTRAREFESHLTSARLEEQRRVDELERLRGRIEEELGLVELELGPGQTGQTPLPLHPLVSKLPSVTQLPEGLEDEIKRLRLQLRRLGAINPSAPQEYEETLERHTFLQEQSSDLVTASESLRQVIAEMDGLIEHAFRQTFEAVAAEFGQTFSTLFGGGKARLELTDPDDLTHTGVEIVAQPPGKRLQPLDLLSGGERSLTAVALIFSILKVSPTPFCILDEVDAMLDEANVGRFRRMLESLADITQIVIITHNRGTIEAASTIYGVTMEADGASQVISRRMDGEQAEPDPVVENGTQMDTDGR